MTAPRTAELARAEEECAREPIHRPGAIQAGGMLYVLDPGTGGIVGRSANARVLAAATLAALPAAIAAAGATPRALDGVETEDGARWSATLHAAASGVAILELEPEEAPADCAAAIDHLGDAIDALAAASDVTEAAAAAAARIRAMTGFDRVMVYRFAPDWSGEVIAEDLAGPQIDSFAGLRFPASDIPPQARALYRLARVRLIADAAAPPVPLETQDAALDLGRSTLRAVSPVHLAYLANMGVRASMSVAIGRAQGDELWGLLACHHQSGPRPLGHRVRQAAAALGRALAWRIAELEQGEAGVLRAQLAELASSLGRALADPDRAVETALAPLGDALRAPVAGSAVFLLLDAGRVLVRAGEAGAVPIGLDQALAAASAPGTDAFETETTYASALGAAGALLAEAGWFGLIARRIVAGGALGGEVWAVWLRREFRREVVWAGNPEKTLGPPTAPDALPTLSPRHSFAAWREEVAGRSAPFAPIHRVGADLVREALREAFLRRAQAVAAALEEFRRRNEAIRFFADAAVHDLREPLWQIQVFAGALREDLPEASEAFELAQVIETSAGRMRAMIDDLGQFATADSMPDGAEPVALAKVAAEAAEDLGEQLRASGGAVAIMIVDLPPVPGDATRLRRVFQNLFSNAIKYRDPQRRLRIEVAGVRIDDQLRCTVSDNGRGFEPAERERIFEPFLRLDQPGAARSEGLGLGLAICRRILEGHGGSITAEGRPGEGARFELMFPLGVEVP